jgi:hypothetical protein
MTNFTRNSFSYICASSWSFTKIVIRCTVNKTKLKKKVFQIIITASTPYSFSFFRLPIVRYMQDSVAEEGTDVWGYAISKKCLSPRQLACDYFILCCCCKTKASVQNFVIRVE